MTEEEKRKKIMEVVEAEIEELRGSFSSFDCAAMREKTFDKMYSEIEKLQKKQQEKSEKSGLLKRILRSVKSKFLK